METDKLHIREYIHSDLPEVLNLWENHSGWGRPDEEEFQRWIKTPFGACILIVAEKEDKEIVGQLFFTPTEIFMEGIAKNAVKVSSPIIHAHYRANHTLNANSLVVSLFSTGIQLMKERGYDWSYNFPAFGWVKILRSIHHIGLDIWDVEVIPCYEIVDDAVTNCNYYFLEMEKFPEDLQIFWDKFKMENKDLSFVTRDPLWLEYKWGAELKLGIYKNNIQEGYFVIKRDSGLILDYIINDFKDSANVFRELNRFYKERRVIYPNTQAEALKFMPNGLLKRYLNGLSIKPIDFNFVFGISSLKAERLGEKTESDKWYIFPND